MPERGSQFTEYGRTPAIGRVHIAVKGGHISEEEGADLNPRYNPANKKYNAKYASTIRRSEREPDKVKELARENKRKNSKIDPSKRLGPQYTEYGRTPRLGNIHIAVEGGHISKEEGMDLNPKYNPTDKNNASYAYGVRRLEKEPDKVRELARKRAAKYRAQKNVKSSEENV